jgi:hypothetical protein
VKPEWFVREQTDKTSHYKTQHGSNVGAACTHGLLAHLGLSKAYSDGSNTRERSTQIMQACVKGTKSAVNVPVDLMVGLDQPLLDVD